MLGEALLLARMWKDQWKSEEELQDLSEQKLLSLIKHAKATVPFYKRTLSSVPVRSIQDLQDIGLVKRSDIQADADSFISAIFDRPALHLEHTSGSSGVPLATYTSRKDRDYFGASEVCHALGCGASPFDNQAKITHYQITPHPLQRLGILSCDYLPVLDDEAALLGKLERIRPKILKAYPSVLLAIARLNSSKGLGLSFRMILPMGETLSQSVRKEVSESFGCPIYDRYGTTEASWVAMECTEGSLHLQDGYVHTEIVDDHGQPVRRGAVGRIVVTPLWRSAMPLIRYCQGDIGAIGGPCRCGRGQRTLRMLRGREDDRITLPSGKVRSARSINYLDDIKVGGYQIIQERDDLFVFRYVAPEPMDVKEEARVRNMIRAGCLGEVVAVEFEKVDSLPRGRTGKLRTIISKVKPDGK
ncbi:MAG: AMP-binding protein [Candidatus Micrarchaeota archaeon]